MGDDDHAPMPSAPPTMDVIQGYDGVAMADGTCWNVLGCIFEALCYSSGSKVFDVIDLLHHLNVGLYENNIQNKFVQGGDIVSLFAVCDMQYF